MLKKMLFGAAVAMLASTAALAQGPPDLTPAQMEVWKARLWCMYAGGEYSVGAVIAVGSGNAVTKYICQWNSLKPPERRGDESSESSTEIAHWVPCTTTTGC